MKLAISPLGEDLERIKSQQIELIRKLKHHDEWKYWAAAEVQKVGDSTNGLRTSEAVSITEDFNNRYALQLRNCVGDFLWEQIRFNLDLSKILKGLQSPTSQLIEAAETCPNTKAKTCRKNVRNAINGLQSAPQDINNLLEGSDQLQETQKQSNQCLDKTLKEYAEERAEVERQLQDIIDEYLESKTPNN
ncbi:uncharacterized protein LOC108091884 isoform X2 [Drosophila ficusphila]|nr:uncharacterized protein LOC108091884 isoform X2 [Drosophila ficusphila]